MLINSLEEYYYEYEKIVNDNVSNDIKIKLLKELLEKLTKCMCCHPFSECCYMQIEKYNGLGEDWKIKCTYLFTKIESTYFLELGRCDTFCPYRKVKEKLENKVKMLTK